MKDCNKKCDEKPYEVLGITAIDIDDLASTPDYFLGVRELLDPKSGNLKEAFVRVPGERVMPTGNLANVIALPTNNTALNIPEGQVRGGYIDTGVSVNEMKLADKVHPAEFLMLGAFPNDKMLIQSTGFLKITGGHRYIVGTQYYLGENGEPVTDKEITGQKLFKPLSNDILLVNGAF